MSDPARFDSPQAALAALLSEVKPVTTERVALSAAAGRVLAEPLRTDRDSPPCDTSAMDGYAVRLADLARGELPVAGEVAIGQPPPEMPLGTALRIVTGAPVPAGADAVIRREDTDEFDRTRIVLRIPTTAVLPGQHIRRRGENRRAGSLVLAAGALIGPAVMSALAAFGRGEVEVYRRVRVGILNSGDELVAADPARPGGEDDRRAPAQARNAEVPLSPFQIRDSNGPGLEAFIRFLPWCVLVHRQQVADNPTALRQALMALRATSDLVITTGGVSAGDHDYVPQVVRDCGGRIIFHKLPVRPGKPVLGAVCDQTVIIGLPGNPVSALGGARRLVRPVLGYLAGQVLAEPSTARSVEPPVPRVRLVRTDETTLKLWWWRLVRLNAQGEAELVANRGSGDLVAAALSDGFVEIPPGESGEGPWPFYRWEA